MFDGEMYIPGDTLLKPSLRKCVIFF